MKTFIFAAILSLFGGVLSAEPVKMTAPVSGTAPVAVSNGAKSVKAVEKKMIKDKNCVTEERYCCEKHEKFESLGPGKCPVCKSPLSKQIKSFTYKCQACGMTSDKPGTCQTDKGAKLKKFRVIYTCVPDNITSGLPGNCPKCGEPLKKIVGVPVK